MYYWNIAPHGVTMADTKEQVFNIPKTCKGGVVVNEGPDFRVEVRDVPVPEISEFTPSEDCAWIVG